jgi:hypothetical protein
MTVVGPETCKELQDYVDYPEPPKATYEQVIQLIALSRAGKFAKDVSDDEYLLASTVDNEILRQHSFLDLEYAVKQMRMESKWKPDISEIHKKAGYAAAMRGRKRALAQMLIDKHEREYERPKEYVRPEEVQAILDEFKGETK